MVSHTGWGIVRNFNKSLSLKTWPIYTCLFPWNRYISYIRTYMSKTMTTPSPPEVCPPIYYPPPSQPPHDNVLNWKPWKLWLFKSTILCKKQYTKFQFSTFIFVKNSCLDKLVEKGQKLTSNWHFCSFQKNCKLAFVRKSCSLTGRENSS